MPETPPAISFRILEESLARIEAYLDSVDWDLRK